MISHNFMKTDIFEGSRIKVPAFWKYICSVSRDFRSDPYCLSSGGLPPNGPLSCRVQHKDTSLEVSSDPEELD